MHVSTSGQSNDPIFSIDEIAEAAGVSAGDVRALAKGRRIPIFGEFVRQIDAIRLVRALSTTVADDAPGSRAPLTLMATRPRRTVMSLVASGAAHALLVLAFLTLASLGFFNATYTDQTVEPQMNARLVFLMSPGPGGGGGGGGLKMPEPPPPAAKKAPERKKSPSPVPPPRRVVPRPRPEPPRQASSPRSTEGRAAPDRNAQARALARNPGAGRADRHRPGRPGRTPRSTKADRQREQWLRVWRRNERQQRGSGRRTGRRDRSGIGGGTGGGPYQPGAGISPPTLRREVKPIYTDEARRALSRATSCSRSSSVRTAPSAPSSFCAGSAAVSISARSKP